MSTIKDVAQVAGVSIATVSNVVSGKRYVSPALAKRVRFAMEELSYVPNALARGLRGGGTKTVGLVIPDNSNPFFAELSRAVENAGFAKGYSVILCNTDNQLGREQAYVEVLLAKRVDGVLFISSGGDDELLGELLGHGVPVTLIDRDVTLAGTDVILLDNRQGGYDATRYLIDLGHRDIACIAGPRDLGSSNERVRGYRDALTDAGMSANRPITYGEFTFAAGENAGGEILAGKANPTAVFACNDLIALGVLRAARQAGLAVPTDLSVIGFDGIAVTSVVSPALTTMSQPIQALANAALESLIRCMVPRDDCEGRRVVFSASLTKRESCAARA